LELQLRHQPFAERGAFAPEGKMLKRIIQSTCFGIASVVLSAFVIGFIGFSLAAISTPSSSPDTGQEVGWDLVALARGLPSWVWLFPLGFFAVGFLIGYRYFLKPQERKEIGS
jgi:hypothetical protein